MDPEHLKAWFAPRPFETIECEIDLRPGGIFRAVMRAPDGTVFNDETGGCFLEVHEPHRLVWTSALAPGYRPLPPPEDGGFAFTAELTFEAVGTSTRYSARAIHASRDGAAAHEDMGISDGGARRWTNSSSTCPRSDAHEPWGGTGGPPSWHLRPLGTTRSG